MFPTATASEEEEVVETLEDDRERMMAMAMLSEEVVVWLVKVGKALVFTES